MMAPLGLSPEDVDALSAVLQGPLGRSVKSEILENVFAEFELTLDESNVKPDAILACIFPELHLVGLKTQTRSEQRVAALATISDSSFMFLLSYSPDNRSHIEKELPQSIQFVLRSND